MCILMLYAFFRYRPVMPSYPNKALLGSKGHVGCMNWKKSTGKFNCVILNSISNRDSKICMHSHINELVWLLADCWLMDVPVG